MTHVTICSSSLPLYEYIMPSIINIDNIEINTEDIYDKVKVFINGIWVGITENPIELYEVLKEKKHKGIINIHNETYIHYEYLTEYTLHEYCLNREKIRNDLINYVDTKVLLK